MRDEAHQDIFGQVVDAARAHGVTEIEAIIAGSNEALTRFANNTIHQNVAERATHLSVRPVIDGRTARASTNRLDRDAIRDVVEQAITIARLTEPDPDLPPLAGPADYQGVERWFEGTARAAPEERAREGLFLAFQYPVEIPGVNTSYFLRTALNEIRQHRGLEAMGAMEFLKWIREKLKLVEMDEKFLKRSVNEGFSGGEKKRNEVLQMAVLEPKLAVLDETDSGLDIDALKIVANGVNSLRNSSNAFIVITHYQRLLDHIVPDFVHVLYDGRIVKSGGRELALHLEDFGYDEIKEEQSTTSRGALN